MLNVVVATNPPGNEIPAATPVTWWAGTTDDAFEVGVDEL